VIAAIAEDYPLLGQFLGHVAIIPKIDHPQLTGADAPSKADVRRDYNAFKEAF